VTCICCLLSTHRKRLRIALTSSPAECALPCSSSPATERHTCAKTYKKRMTMPGGRKKDAFITVGYTNWKDAAGQTSGGFASHERSEVSDEFV